MTSTEESTLPAFLGKEPSLLHQSLAEYIEERTEGEVEISPRLVQAVLALHGEHQASDRNKTRPGYRPRTKASIHKGGATTAERFQIEDEEVAPEPEPKPTRARKPRQPRKAVAKAS